MNPGSPEPLKGLEDRLDYRFENPELLRRALTHRSVQEAGATSNERLEFLGDAVLGCVISTHLYDTHPDFQEGKMTRIKSRVVSRKTLAERAQAIELSRWLIVGRMFPTPESITDSILSNAFEAIIGAVFLDGGHRSAEDFVLDHLDAPLRKATNDSEQRDFKSWLGQWAQRQHQETPTYELLSVAGPDHGRTFETRAVLGERSFPPGWGRSKKEAEQRAARAALRDLGLL